MKSHLARTNKLGNKSSKHSAMIQNPPSSSKHVRIDPEEQDLENSKVTTPLESNTTSLRLHHTHQSTTVETATMSIGMMLSTQKRDDAEFLDPGTSNIMDCDEDILLFNQHKVKYTSKKKEDTDSEATPLQLNDSKKLPDVRERLSKLDLYSANSDDSKKEVFATTIPDTVVKSVGSPDATRYDKLILEAPKETVPANKVFQKRAGNAPTAITKGPASSYISRPMAQFQKSLQLNYISRPYKRVYTPANNAYRQYRQPSFQRKEDGQFPSHWINRPRLFMPPKIRNDDSFADKLPLLTDRGKVGVEQNTPTQVDTQKYLAQCEVEDDITIKGYFIWINTKAHLHGLFGLKLEKLNVIRTSQRVYINWNDHMRAIEFSAPLSPTAGNRILAAIKATRLAIQVSVSKRVAAPTKYVVMPPAVDAIRSSIMPRLARTTSESLVAKVTGFELSGKAFSDEKAIDYTKYRKNMVADNVEAIREHLVTGVENLAVLRCWLRMRVHFGHLHLTQYKKDFPTGEHSFDNFVGMMKSNRVKGEFERRIRDPLVATRLVDKILSWPKVEWSPSYRWANLATEAHSEKFEHRAVIFTTTKDGPPYRLEASIDSSDIDGDDYMLGCSQLFLDNQDKKKLEIAMVDVEMDQDWNIQVVTGSLQEMMPDNLQRLIGTSLAGRSRLDSLGLRYPVIAPHGSYGVRVTKVMVKSKIEFLLTGSGYVIDVSINRQWNGLNVKAEPVITTTVTLRHPRWDAEMDDLQHFTKESLWTMDLQTFFPCEGESNNGIEDFVTLARAIAKEMQSVMVLENRVNRAIETPIAMTQARQMHLHDEVFADPPITKPAVKSDTLPPHLIVVPGSAPTNNSRYANSLTSGGGPKNQEPEGQRAQDFWS